MRVKLKMGDKIVSKSECIKRVNTNLLLLFRIYELNTNEIVHPSLLLIFKHSIYLSANICIRVQ